MDHIKKEIPRSERQIQDTHTHTKRAHPFGMCHFWFNNRGSADKHMIS